MKDKKEASIEEIKENMTKFENYSKELKDYIQYACPYKIGDRIRINSLYRGYSSTDEVIHHGVIVDIEVTTKRQILFRNGLSDILRLLDDQNIAMLDEPVTEFVLTYRYEDEIGRDKYKFWKRPHKEIVESTIAIDSYGNNVQRASTVRKIIEKE